MNTEKEIWKTIPGYDGMYQVSNLGRVKSFRKWRGFCPEGGRIMKTSRPGHEYDIASLFIPDSKKVFNAMVPRLVLEAFTGPHPPNKPYACHNDGKPFNNVHSNLRWGSNADNQADRILHGTSNRGSANGQAKLTEADVILIKTMIKDGFPNKKIAPLFPFVDSSMISMIRIGRHWKHLHI